LKLAFFERNQLTGSLEPMCEFPGFHGRTVLGRKAELLIADCDTILNNVTVAGGDLVHCTCCTCCAASTPGLCNANVFVASIDGIKEMGYQREQFVFGKDTVFN
jgi:hypothetical protein